MDTSTAPKVSFIVPCYKLAHLLGECVNSILWQTYRDFEVLIMDDCSPDNTPEVAHSFDDPRVFHIRNELNLGHLRNYNKGITLARGRYIWLISADDRLRKSDALERYLQLMENHPNIGYVLSPCIALQDDRETGILKTFFHGDRDAIFNGRQFLLRLFHGAGIASPSAMARKECYEKLSMFPLDLPHQGDMYLWQMWAIYYDVGYLAEPMVNYRLHSSSMMSVFRKTDPWILIKDEIAVLWHTKYELQKAGYSAVQKSCERAIIQKYIYCMLCDRSDYSVSNFRMTVERFEESLSQFLSDPREKNRVRAFVFAGLADEYYWKNDFRQACGNYGRSLGQKFMVRVWAKYLCVRMGVVGAYLRTIASFIRTTTVAVRGLRFQ